MESTCSCEQETKEERKGARKRILIINLLFYSDYVYEEKFCNICKKQQQKKFFAKLFCKVIVGLHKKFFEKKKQNKNVN